MPNTYSKLYIQIVFAVKGRRCFIEESFREELQKYISGIIREKEQKLYAIYCMPDHTHIFVSIKPDIAISDLVRDVKSNSSSFIKEKLFVINFSWQKGFGAFSYSKSQVVNVVNYIIRQPEHHKKKSFKQEYIAFLQKFEIDYDDKYLFEILRMICKLNMSLLRSFGNIYFPWCYWHNAPMGLEINLNGKRYQRRLPA